MDNKDKPFKKEQYREEKNEKIIQKSRIPRAPERQKKKFTFNSSSSSSRKSSQPESVPSGELLSSLPSPLQSPLPSSTTTSQSAQLFENSPKTSSVLAARDRYNNSKLKFSSNKTSESEGKSGGIEAAAAATNEITGDSLENIIKSNPKKKYSIGPTTIITSVPFNLKMGRKSVKEKDTKRSKRTGAPTKERWLLTRKTWKYMTDAGRRLIPEGASNRPEDIPKIEEHFQHVCQNETRFIIWRRKCSYPGALPSSKYFKLRNSNNSSGSNNNKWSGLLIKSSKRNKSSSKSLERKAEIQEQLKNTEQILRLLQNVMKISGTDGIGSDVIGTGNSPSFMMKTNSDKKTFSLENINERNITIEVGSEASSGTGSGNETATREFNKKKTEAEEIPLKYLMKKTEFRDQNLNDLLQKLKLYSSQAAQVSSGSGGSTSPFLLHPDMVTTDILENKALLRKIYNDLKKQQLNRVLGRHIPPSPHSLSHSLSLTSLFHSTAIGSGPGSIGNSSKSSSIESNFDRRNTNTTIMNPNLSVSSFGSISNSSSITEFPRLHPSSTADHYHHQQQQQDTLRNVSQTSTQQQISLSPTTSSSIPSEVQSQEGRKIKKKNVTSKMVQTNFIHLSELQRLAKEYDLMKKDEESHSNRQTDEESDKGGSGSCTTTAATGHGLSKRKSSIDNEDVSQSVSDTIKRYLRMARKKSVQDDTANRFKRVNYDRNLRNIQAKGEINPPGMDEEGSKGTQTLDAWAKIAIYCIRGLDISEILNESHISWNKSLEARIQRKKEYDQQMQEKQQQEQQQQQQQQQQKNAASGTSSPPLQHSPPGIFQTGTQFLSNLLHGQHHHHHNPTSPSSNTDKSQNNAKNAQSSSLSSSSTTSVSVSQQHQQQQQQQQQNSSRNSSMQKSKSSSHVGQFVSRKIWRSRSKSQTRPSSHKSEWTPQGNCIWTSSNGKRVTLSDVKLQNLTEIERRILHKVAIEKINQLNIGVNVSAPNDSNNTTVIKSPKRRPLLLKRKALTTGFFDSNKKSSSKENIASGLVFGITLEKCVDNDTQRIRKVSQTNERGSRNSIVSLFGAMSGSKTSSNENIGSCESLISRGQNQNKLSDDSSFLANSSINQIFRSQSDIRRSSQEDEINSDVGGGGTAPPMTSFDRSSSGQQVPALVDACMDYLETHGLDSVGIFRVGASKKRVRQLREDFDRGEISSIKDGTSPHDVATILKEYLRDLPEPLLCSNLYKAFVKTQKIRNRRLQLEALSHLVELLPVAHRDTLYALLKFLAKIARASDDTTSRDGTVLASGNKMDSNNLATVFAPNILRFSNSNQNTTEQEIEDQIDVINVIRTMIDHYEELFKVPAELLDEVYTNMIDSYPQQLDYLCEKRDVIEKKYSFSSTDEVESCCTTSTTPLSSPPATTGQRNLSPDLFYSFSRDVQQLQQQQQQQHHHHHQSLTEILGSNNISKRVYSREDFLHENTVKGDPFGNENTTAPSVPKRRERASRMKYVESEHETLRRRRRATEKQQQQELINRYNPHQSQLSATVAGGALNTNIIENNLHSTSSNLTLASDSSRYHHQEDLNITSSSSNFRGLPAPHILHDTGIVTASLKIPLQMQMQSSSGTAVGGNEYSNRREENITNYSSNYSSGGSNSGLHLDYSDIPFIEDSGITQEYESTQRQVPIKGSISLGLTDSNSMLSMQHHPKDFYTEYEDKGIYSSSTTSPTESISPQSSFAITAGATGTSSSSGIGLLTVSSSRQKLNEDSTTTETIKQRTKTSTGSGNSRSNNNSAISNNNNNNISSSNISRKHSSSSSDLKKQFRSRNSTSNNNNNNDNSDENNKSNINNSNNNNNNNVKSDPGSPTKPITVRPTTSLSQIEPRITPSISNIGGAVLRSKTADFERISTVKNKKYSIGNDTEEISKSSSTDSVVVPITMTTTSTTGNYSNQQPHHLHQQHQQQIEEQQQQKQYNQNQQLQQQQQHQQQRHIYKRQELISSTSKKR